MPNHNRRSIRLRGYDYTSPGAYFVTICTHERAHLFGRVEDGTVILSDFGRVVRTVWQNLSRHFDHVRLDEFVVMPNHVHGIIWIVDDVGARHPHRPGGLTEPGATVRPTGADGTVAGDASPLPDGTPSGSLGAIVANFKSVATRRINGMRYTPDAAVWQRNYYEHIVRHEDALAAIRQYIRDNPVRWQWDRYNADALGPDATAVELWQLLKRS